MDGAYHCRVLTECKELFRNELSQFKFKKPRFPVYRNVDARLYDAANLTSGMLDHFDTTVHFDQSVRNALNDMDLSNSTIEVFDLGSGGFLTKCLEDIEQTLPQTGQTLNIVKNIHNS